MTKTEKLELVLDVFRRDSWKPSVDTFDTVKKALGPDTSEESWFKVFTRDYLYIKNGLVNTRNIGSAQTFLEQLIYRNRTPEDEEFSKRKKALVENIGKLQNEVERKDLEIKTLNDIIAEKDKTIQDLENKVISMKNKFDIKLKEKNSKIASLYVNKKYWEKKAKKE